MWQVLLLLAALAGPLTADDTLYISPISLSRWENETVTLNCFTSRTVDNYYLIWGSAKPGDLMISWILYWMPGSSAALYPSVVSDRFIGSKDWTSKKFSLTIKGLRQEDSARYYCGSSNTYFPFSTDWSGCGVTLTVKAAPSASPPLVYFQNPHPEDVFLQKNISLLCAAESFYPDDLSFSWRVDGEQVHRGVSHSASLLGDNGTYTAISKLVIDTSQWIKGSIISCQVSHGALPSPIIKYISNTERYPMEPKLYLLSPTLEELVTMEKATLVCLATGFYPAEISFHWFINGNPVVNSIKTYPPILNINGTYSSQSELTTSDQMWNRGTEYTCEIQHMSVPDSIIQTINKTREFIFLQPTITPIKVQSRDSHRPQAVTLACFVSGFYPAGIYVNWRTERDLQVPGSVTNFPVVRDVSGTYSTVSQMTIAFVDVDPAQTYMCEVRHESLTNPLRERFQIS
ncbi:immunoglobulin gamma-1 heavy chain-like [Rhincodon typus]|uniref:immunoglobulin gamma-1 heavy chain-like n=1 Tax=Rhincodon typus TaxID=259920 RepID=UPI00202EC083|nr:immunoglobulin gamma-1 heavy chain-like [Rhincodon typus]